VPKRRDRADTRWPAIDLERKALSELIFQAKLGGGHPFPLGGIPAFRPAKYSIPGISV
jgi:hypothetical protein